MLITLLQQRHAHFPNKAAGRPIHIPVNLRAETSDAVQDYDACATSERHFPIPSPAASA